MEGGPRKSPWQRPDDAAAPAGRGLDRASRRAVRWFLLRLCCIAALSALSACLERQSPSRTFAATLSMTCGLAAVVCAVHAVKDGHLFAKGPLNTLDEALAFVALSRLAHLALGLGWA